ncbi:DUF4129 domain-containing transglutaminase family protein [Chloroflexota bacterium]
MNRKDILYMLKKMPFSLQQLVGIGLMLLVLGIAVYSIEHTRWIDPNPPLMLILVLSILAGLITSKSRLSPATAVLVAVITGGIVTLWQALDLFTNFSILTPDLITTQIYFLWTLISTGKAIFSTIPFSIFLVLAIWLMGFCSIWFLIKRRTVWVAITIGTIAILSNMSNTSENSYLYTILFFPLALLLIGQVNLTRYIEQSGKVIFVYSRRILFYMTAGLLLTSILAMSIAWGIPVNRTNYLQRYANLTEVYQTITRNPNINIFASVPSKWRILASENYQALIFGEPDTGTDVLFTVSSPSSPAYLRTRSFDVYKSSVWTNSLIRDNQIPGNTIHNNGEKNEYRSEISYKVINKSKTDIILAAGEFHSTDIPVILHMLEDGNDIVTISSLYQMKPDDEYTITVKLNTGTAEQLSAAGVNYPEHIKDYNLQLPDRLPREVRSLTRFITRNQTTSYDKVVAIRNYLVGLKYVQQGTVPPSGTDAVDDFLFNTREGNCTNFATAMVVMLRCAGVPARISSGYILRQPDAAKNTYNIRPVDYHARPEAYFPGFGWIEFEATPVPEFNIDLYGQMPATFPTDIQPLAEEIAILEESPSDPETNSGEGIGTAAMHISTLDDWLNEKLESSSLGLNTTIFLLVIGVLALFLIIAFLWMRQWLRRVSREDDPSAIWGRMCSFGSLLKLRPASHQTPLEYGNYLVNAFPGHKNEIDNLVWMYLENTYGRRENIQEQHRTIIRESWHKLLDAFIKRLIDERTGFIRRLKWKNKPV